MNHLFSGRRVFALFVLCAVLALSAYSLAAQDAPLAEETPELIEMTFGPGAFNLLPAAEGLSDLSSYRATLTLSFEGTQDGEPAQWSRTYVMLADQATPARQLTIDATGDVVSQALLIETGDTRYERRGENACAASAVEAGNTLAERLEPVGFLPVVIGADEAGTETVNNVAANHYTFDERAHGALGAAESSGELWVASDGGYLLRYLLETAGGPDYFGQGIEGTLTWDYQLTDVNQPLAIEVPEDCPVGMVEVPILPDATDIFRAPGMTTYTTLTSLADAATFYDAELTASGAEASFPADVSDTIALLEYVQGDQLTTVIATAQDGITSVMVAVTSSVLPEASAPEPITIQVGGETVALPMLPDAANVFNSPDGSGYTTLTSIEDAAAFYEEQMIALGGQVQSPLALFGNIGVIEFTLGGNLIAINILGEDGGNNLFIRIDPPNSPVVEVPVPVATQAPAQPVVATLPAAEPEQPSADCALAIDDIPILPDATSLMNMQGVIFYTTPTSSADIVAFYDEQLTALGAESASPPMVSDFMSSLTFTQGGQIIAVTIIPAGGFNSVNIAVQSMNPFAPASNCSAAVAVPDQAPALSEDASACSVSTATSANQRSGPGTNFNLAGTLAGGANAAVEGQATGADGFVWWRLGEGVWVRSDVVDEAGNCDSVPVVQP